MNIITWNKQNSYDESRKKSKFDLSIQKKKCQSYLQWKAVKMQWQVNNCIPELQANRKLNIKVWLI